MPTSASPANNSAAGTYKTDCVSCHGPDGRGSAVGKSLHAADFHSAQVQQQSDAQLAGVIAEGRGNMPAFGTRLSKDQIDALVKYIRTLAKAKKFFVCTMNTAGRNSCMRSDDLFVEYSRLATQPDAP